MEIKVNISEICWKLGGSVMVYIHWRTAKNSLGKCFDPPPPFWAMPKFSRASLACIFTKIEPKMSPSENWYTDVYIASTPDLSITDSHSNQSKKNSSYWQHPQKDGSGLIFQVLKHPYFSHLTTRIYNSSLVHLSVLHKWTHQATVSKRVPNLGTFLTFWVPFYISGFLFSVSWLDSRK